MLILRGLMIRRLPRRPSPNPPNRSRRTQTTGDAVDDLFRSPAWRPQRRPEAESESEPEAEQEAVASTDPNQALQYEPRVSQAQTLKKVLVEEQSTLLDGVRQERLGCHRRRRG